MWRHPRGLCNLSVGVLISILVILPGHMSLGGILRHILFYRTLFLGSIVRWESISVVPVQGEVSHSKKFGFLPIWSGAPSHSVLSIITSSTSPKSGLVVIILILTFRRIRQW